MILEERIFYLLVIGYWLEYDKGNYLVGVCETTHTTHDTEDVVVDGENHIIVSI